MTYLNEKDPLAFYDDIYNAAPIKFTREEKAEAVELFDHDFTHIMEDINDFADATFGITAENVCSQHIFKFRRLNKLLSEAYAVAEELAAVTKKENEKKAIK
jgi:hypothetical protein